MRIAREIQQRLFPEEAPQLDGLELAGLTECGANGRRLLRFCAHV